MRFSQFGSKFMQDSGVIQLMDDLGDALRRPGMIMLGGGNPARIPEMENYFSVRMAQMLETGEFADLIGVYDAPEGNYALREALAGLLQRECNWPVTPEHIALTNGSQTAFFFLFNLLAGNLTDGRRGRILLPVTPEYIGYADVGTEPDLFVARRPQIEIQERPFFKYRLDFDALAIDDGISAICVSRPTNPTGNVLTADELARLSALARAHELPLIIDNAYGWPFPNILFVEDVLPWEPHVIMCLSLSKLGMPGARTGIVVADPEVIRGIKGMNALISLAPNSLGAALTLDAIRSGEILRLGEEVIRPHYEAKAAQAVQWLTDALDDVEFYIHRPEGAFFLWVWFKGLPITSQALYERLKAQGVIVLSGHHFFPGLTGAWDHRHECIRLNYAGDPAMVQAGIERIAAEVRRAMGRTVG